MSILCIIILEVESIAKRLKRSVSWENHYSNVLMSAMASQITNVLIVCSAVCSGADQRKHQSSALLAFVGGIHQLPVDSPHKGPVSRKMFPFADAMLELPPPSPPSPEMTWAPSDRQQQNPINRWNIHVNCFRISGFTMWSCLVMSLSRWSTPFRYDVSMRTFIMYTLQTNIDLRFTIL